MAPCYLFLWFQRMILSSVMPFYFRFPQPGGFVVRTREPKKPHVAVAIVPNGTGWQSRDNDIGISTYGVTLEDALFGTCPRHHVFESPLGAGRCHGILKHWSGGTNINPPFWVWSAVANWSKICRLQVLWDKDAPMQFERCLSPVQFHLNTECSNKNKKPREVSKVIILVQK